MDQKLVKKKKKRVKSSSVVKQKSEFDIPGVVKLELSTISQKVIGCEVYKDVTSEEPWMYIKKEDIEDNIDLHENSSEFLPIKDDIQKHKGKQILVGFREEISLECGEFYLCITQEGEENVLKILEEKKQNLEMRLKKFVARECTEWNSLGSEIEIDDDILKNLRPLLEVEIPINIPFRKTPNLNFCNVEDSIFGYMELLDKRTQYNIVKRSRIDKAIQSAHLKKEINIQTNPKYPKNIWTQYEYFSNENDKENFLKEKSTCFKLTEMNYLNDSIKINAAIDMYLNDYQQLSDIRKGAWGDYVKAVQFDTAEDPFMIKQLYCFEDLLTCNGYNVTNFNYSPLICGHGVACYMRFAYNYIHNEFPTHDEVHDAVYRTCPLLVWSYDDMINPKLYLQTPRGVHYASYNPYITNFIVGGSINGQIYIWDLQDHLEQIENMPVLTTKQEDNRRLIMELLNWMNYDYNMALVKPTAVSSVKYSLGGALRFIHYISPNWEITSSGIYRKLKDDEERSSMFITISSDGYWTVWNLKDPLVKFNPEKPKRKLKRLKVMPEELTRHSSPYTAYNKVLKPYYRLRILDEKEHIYPLISLCMAKPENYYRKIRNDERDNTRNCYTLDKIEEKNYKQEFLVCTLLGDILKITWEGFEFDTGDSVAVEIPKNIKKIESHHEGPVEVCSRNPQFPHIILTIGGSSWSIWSENCFTKPIFHFVNILNKYKDGDWCTINPIYIYVLRQDGYMEYWNIIENTDQPERVVNMSFAGIQKAFNTYYKREDRQKTFALSDNTGALRVFNIPNRICFPASEEDIKRFKTLFQREENKREIITKWKNEWKMKYIQHSQKEIIRKKSIPVVEKEEPIEIKQKMTLTDKWIAEQEIYMRDVLLKKKNLDINEILKQKEPLDALKRENAIRQRKIDKAIEGANTKYQLAIQVLLSDMHTKTQQKYSVDHTDLSFILKNEYERHKQEALQFIAQNRFSCTFNWVNTINMALKKRQAIQEWIRCINVSHYRRQKLKKIFREKSFSAKGTVTSVS